MMLHMMLVAILKAICMPCCQNQFAMPVVAICTETIDIRAFGVEIVFNGERLNSPPQNLLQHRSDFCHFFSNHLWEILWFLVGIGRCVSITPVCIVGIWRILEDGLLFVRYTAHCFWLPVVLATVSDYLASVVVGTDPEGLVRVRSHQATRTW
jgi:hypothetical protein